MKNAKNMSLLLLILITGICSSAHADPTPRIAVLEFLADGADASYAIAARTKIEIELVKRGFHIIERRNIKKVLGERATDYPCKDAKCAARQGKMVSADYVVVGEIIYTDRYMIGARIVDVHNDRIIFADSAVSNKKNGILALSERIAAKLSRHMGDKAVQPVQKRPVNINGCLNISGGYVLPVAYLRDNSKNGYALAVSAGSSIDDFFIGLKSGFIQLFASKTEPYAYIIPIMASFRYDLQAEHFYFSLRLSAGMSVNYICESKKKSVQAIVNPGLAMGYKTKVFGIYTLAEYFCIPEQKRGIQFLNFGLGSSFWF